MKNFRFMQPYPLYKVECEEVINKYNSKSEVFRIYVKIAEPMNWTLLYVVNSLAWAKISLDKLKELFDTHIIRFIIEDELPTMFEVNNEVYKAQYVFPEQSCIVGEQIPRNLKYVEYYSDCVKFDYVKSLVSFYYKGTCLVKGNQLFIDGELVYNEVELKELCDKLDLKIYQLDSNPDKLVQYLRCRYTTLRRYICEGYATYFENGDDIYGKSNI